MFMLLGAREQKKMIYQVFAKLPIKPLSLHGRIHEMPEKRPYSTLIITGSFSIGQAHQWILEAYNHIVQVSIIHL